MRSSHPLRWPLFFVVISIVWCLRPDAAVGQKFTWPPPPPQPGAVAEYFNTHTGHYFYTMASHAEARDLEAVPASGWVLTGHGFGAFSSIEASTPQPGGSGQRCDLETSPCVAIDRFYGPGPNSHFYTGNREESRDLQRPGSGWLHEGVAFALPLPDPQGQCPERLLPVHRFYNNRWMFNDSNHRFTASEPVRRHMVDQGWVYEGVAFCTYGASKSIVNVWQLRDMSLASIHTAEACSAGLFNGLSCLGIGNLPLPTMIFAGPARSETLSDPFNQRLGLYDGPGAVNAAYAATSREMAASNTFVQFWGPPNDHLVGIHLSTRNRGPSSYTWAGMHRALPRTEPDGIFPWRVRYGTPRSLQFHFMLGLKEFAALPGGAAYGVSSIEFIDARSRREVQFNVLAYGTIPGGELIARDVKTGIAIVATSFDRQSRYATMRGELVNRVVSPDPRFGVSKTYFVNIDRGQFRAIIDAAATVDAALSRNPDDYMLKRFGVANEIFGEGQIAMYALSVQMFELPE